MKQLFHPSETGDSGIRRNEVFTGSPAAVKAAENAAENFCFTLVELLVVIAMMVIMIARFKKAQVFYYKCFMLIIQSVFTNNFLPNSVYLVIWQKLLTIPSFMLRSITLRLINAY